jgi:hypothetical protein
MFTQKMLSPKEEKKALRKRVNFFKVKRPRENYSLREQTKEYLERNTNFKISLNRNY